ncbi:MAG: class I SAM-dependent methyltransferase family protein [bacterium]
MVSENKEVKILNIASGSARAVLESVDEMPLDNDVKLSAVFIDRNQEAISFSQQLAGNHKYQSSFKWVNDTAENFLEKEGHKTRFNTVELVGLLEYLDDENAIEMFSIIYKTLEAGGTLITSNITHNAEKRFISDVVGWKMIYRSTDEFTSLLISAGFDFDKMKIYYEPQRIHCVIVAQK